MNKNEEKEFDRRPMTSEEDKYAFRQSPQISAQTCLIGYLRADMGSDGKSFFSTWEDVSRRLKTDDFRAELDEVINSLREEGDILHDRRTLEKYCYSTPNATPSQQLQTA